jgi:hypothetical protein
LPPVEFCRGTRPSQAANSRPLRNMLGSATVAATAVALMGPMPGMLAKRWLTGLVWCQDPRFDGSDPRLEFVNLLGDQPQHLTSHAGHAIVLVIPDDRNQPATLCRPAPRSGRIRPNARAAHWPTWCAAELGVPAPWWLLGLREPAYPATLNV